jgi:hypothetical protein
MGLKRLGLIVYKVIHLPSSSSLNSPRGEKRKSGKN